MLRRTILVLLISLPFFGAGPTPKLDAYKGRMLLGFDSEINHQMLSNLVPYFDLDHLQQKLYALPPETLKEQALQPSTFLDYVMNPKALEALSPALKEELTRGLVLTEGLVEKPAHTRPEKIIRLELERGSEGKIVEASQFQPQKKKTPPPAPTPFDRFHAPKGVTDESISVIRSRASDWQILYDRWNALPWETQFKEVQFQFLTPAKLARMIQRVPVASKDRAELAEYLVLKKSAPEALHKLEYSLDAGNHVKGKVFEVNYKGTTTDPEEFLSVIDQFETLAGTRTQIEMPTSVQRGNVAFHMHFTPIDSAFSREQYAEFVSLWNRRQLLRLLELGPEYDALLENSRFAYRSSIYSKESIIYVPYDSYKGFHTESRIHFTGPRTELHEFYTLLEQGPEKANATLAQDIKALFKKTPSLKTRIIDKKVIALLDFINLEPDSLSLARQKLLQALDKGDITPTALVNSTLSNQLSVETLELAEEVLKRYPEYANTSEFAMALYSNPSTQVYLRKSTDPPVLNAEVSKKLFEMVHAHPHYMAGHSGIFKRVLTSEQWKVLEPRYIDYELTHFDPVRFGNLMGNYDFSFHKPPKEILKAVQTHLLDLSGPSVIATLDVIKYHYADEFYRLEPYEGETPLNQLRYRNSNLPDLLAETLAHQGQTEEVRAQIFERALRGNTEEDRWLRRVLSFMNFTQEEDLKAFAYLLNSSADESAEILELFSKYVDLKDRSAATQLEAMVTSEQAKAAVKKAARRLDQNALEKVAQKTVQKVAHKTGLSKLRCIWNRFRRFF